MFPKASRSPITLWCQILLRFSISLFEHAFVPISPLAFPFRCIFALPTLVFSGPSYITVMDNCSGLYLMSPVSYWGHEIPNFGPWFTWMSLRMTGNICSASWWRIPVFSGRACMMIQRCVSRSFMFYGTSDHYLQHVHFLFSVPVNCSSSLLNGSYWLYIHIFVISYWKKKNHPELWCEFNAVSQSMHLKAGHWIFPHNR